MNHRDQVIREIAEAITNWPIGSGYYQSNVHWDEAMAMARAVYEDVFVIHQR